jgi:hypothetical protein
MINKYAFVVGYNANKTRRLEASRVDAGARRRRRRDERARAARRARRSRWTARRRLHAGSLALFLHLLRGGGATGLDFLLLGRVLRAKLLGRERLLVGAFVGVPVGLAGDGILESGAASGRRDDDGARFVSLPRFEFFRVVATSSTPRARPRAISTTPSSSSSSSSSASSTSRRRRRRDVDDEKISVATPLDPPSRASRRRISPVPTRVASRSPARRARARARARVTHRGAHRAPWVASSRRPASRDLASRRASLETHRAETLRLNCAGAFARTAAEEVTRANIVSERACVCVARGRRARAG